ncbi:M67 family metallopeptidase [Paenibacillus sp. KACC 21273]|uniref:M67 family metallopeptidase n=1 Tax=Paenibacillus sp. KACC 21273 TaxID=3025665 RepID=UPI002365EB7E|nr:M67 family metallopeptidase [Paenibacillus sp. KACC 21273]WDF49493.1 M67 family metallopeptidase [Paenibacillus sp. KACC 21273]
MADLLCTDRETTIFIRPTALQLLTDHMNSSLSSEVCGVLLGRKAAGGMRIESYRKLRNVAPDPLHHFLFDPIEWVQCCYQESDLIGIFHSHPLSAPIPSSTDLHQLQSFGALTPIYLIGSPSTSWVDHRQGLNQQWISNLHQHHSDDVYPEHTQPFAIAGYSVIPTPLTDTNTSQLPWYTLQSSTLQLF